MQFPTRININMALGAEVLAYVRSLNSMIVRDGYRDIDFSIEPGPQPHITLLMGEVDTGEDLDCLVQLTQSFAHSRSGLRYTLGKPYLRQPSQRFIFVDVLPQEPFRTLRTALYELASEFIECEHHGGPGNVSHITLGYAHEVYPNLRALIDNSERVAGVAETLQVSEAADRGTCRRVLHQVVLANSR